MNNHIRLAALTAIVLCGILRPAHTASSSSNPDQAPAELSPAGVFSDHMVLQRQVKVPVWGQARPGEKVTVTFKKQTKSAIAGQDGRWMVKLDELETESKPAEMTVSDSKKTVKFTDVLVGEVWFGSGQSNMEWAKQSAPQASRPKDGPGVDAATMELLARASSMVRISSVTRDHLITPNGSWTLITPESRDIMPALMVCTAIYLQERLQVPVGVIVRCRSSSAASEWLRRAVAEADPEITRQRQAAAERGEVGRFLPGPPGLLYDTSIQPAIPYAIRGFVWDQGEQGTGIQGVGFLGVMPALIKDWRQQWGQGELPWVYVQKRQYGNGADLDIFEKKLTELCPNTVMARTGGFSNALHPPNKWKYAQTILAQIMRQAYGEALKAPPACDSPNNEMGPMPPALRPVPPPAH